MKRSHRVTMALRRAGLVALAWWSLGDAARAAGEVSRLAFSAGRDAVVARARRVPVGAGLRVAGVPSGGDAVGTLVLERFEVFSAAAEMVVHGDAGELRSAVPQRLYFRGEVAGDPASIAFMAIDQDDRVKGFVSAGGELRWIGEDDTRPGELTTRRVKPEDDFAPGFRCAAEELENEPGDPLSSISAPAAFENVTAAAVLPLYTADIAIETDFEFYQLFNSVSAAAGYVGDLMGAISAIYYRDIGVTLKVNHLSLWSTSNDPWSQTAAGGLCEFGGWWNTNRPLATYPRATAQFLSGKAVGSGIAWLGVLCRGPFTASPCTGAQGGGYSFISGLRGQFSLTNPSFYWDISGTAHELGHNFNSPHTHCYNNIPSAGAPPVDQCRSGEGGCYSGTTGVPAGGGSIMSYCHLLPGGFANTRLAFGQAGLYGNQSERVTARMRAHVAAQSCLAFTPARPSDFNGDGRSDAWLYRNGAWLEFNLWPGR